MAEENQSSGIDPADVLTSEELALLETPNPPGVRNQEWWDSHPQEKEKARIRAKLRVAQGTFGGARHGRKRNRPAYEIAAAKAALSGEKLAKELIEQATDPLLKAADRRAAIQMLYDMELKVRSERRGEEDHLAKLAGDELTAELFKVLRELTGAEELDDYIDAEAEELDVGDEASEISYQE